MDRWEKLIKDLLSRRDPMGYYIIPVDIDSLSDNKAFLDKLSGYINIEKTIDTAFIKTRSKRIAERVARVFLQKGGLKTPL